MRANDRTVYPGNWIHSFPTHFQWSNATLVTKGMAPWGAVAMGEIDQVVQRLHGRLEEPHAWAEEWCAMAARVERSGDAAAAAGHDATAGNYYLRAGNYYYTGERMVPPGELSVQRAPRAGRLGGSATSRPARVRVPRRRRGT